MSSMTFIVNDSTALEKLSENLIEIRDNFANYAPTDHALITENLKENQKLKRR